MSDFYQTGIVATLHSLGDDLLERLEAELEVHAAKRPVGLVLPALYREFQHPAMERIVDQLRGANYLQRIVVAIGRCNRHEYEQARSFFEGFRTPVTALWMEDERITDIFRVLDDAGVSAGEAGKGRTCWLSFGYLLAMGDVDVITLHDCDIRNYDRRLLARLIYPLVHPNLGFEFAKGYYARVSDRLHGRVSRLFFTPLVRAIQEMTPEVKYLRFLDSFRYALAGEFAMDANLARVNRIPSDWGLEVGVLAEVYRNCAISRICQVDIAHNYDHKHQELSADDPSGGLRRMSCDIAKSLFRTLAQQGVVLGNDQFRALEVFYVRLAQDTIRRYYADALINGLQFDRHNEDTAVATFARSIREGAKEYLDDPLGLPQIPNWNRVVSAVPDVFGRLLEATRDMVLDPVKV
jgi:glucosyl-3-phosphoglycerate synthase